MNHAPINYFGGKFYLAKKLIGLFPAHATYVEVFGGSGVIMLNKPMSKNEVFNDIYEDVYNMYKVISDKYLMTQLRKKLESYPYSRQLYTEYKRINRDNIKDPVLRASIFVYIMNLTFGAMEGCGWRFSTVRNCPSAFRNKIAKIDSFFERFKNVYIDNLDFRNLIKNWDKPDTFFYLDPPYVASSRKTGGYKHEMTDEDHNELLDIILNIKGKFMLSGYSNHIYSEKLNHLYYKEFKCDATIVRKYKNAQRERTEIVWANYDLNNLT